MMGGITIKDLQSELQAAIKNKTGFDEQYRQLMNQAFKDPDVQAFIKKHHIDNDAVRHSAARIYEFVQQKHNANAGKHRLIPGYQPELVFNGHLIDISYSPTMETIEKQKSKALKDRIKSISIPKQARSASFSDIKVEKQKSRMVVFNAAVTFVNQYTKHPHQFVRGMYLYGSFGIGKTFMLGAIANELAERGVSTTMVHFPSFAVEMKNSIADNTNANKLDAVKRAQVLMLDDIGADVISNWIRDEVLGVILEYRMQNELPTFFSSNLSMDDLEKNHLPYDKKNDRNGLRAGRIMQRIRFLAKEYRMEGENLRLSD
ncbi:primosomal protein DnaI [Nicoliella spurrieriana]|uniref:Primosomal protein DnaI n=1 Tax=Nicoliella spurrieriana TaxID=2925830 RepID=A0A976RRZ6_9LACO|nr:primosomal protein DnaI [Nicoliella spurrieriana]UQS86709.1 primosomal protein DnaI [Nicoliella spurrieriana]